MTKNQINLAIRIVLKRDDGKSLEGAAALRALIRQAQQMLTAIESSLTSEARRNAKPAVNTHAMQAFREKLSEKRELNMKAAKAALSLYDTVRISGKSVGDIWYHELDAIRSESAFAASLADQIIRYGIPNRPTRIRDFINKKTLGEMVREASAKSGTRAAA